MATMVAGDMYHDLSGQLLEIGRQIRQKNGYPFDPQKLKEHLQAGIEGYFAPRPRFISGPSVVVPGARHFSARKTLFHKLKSLKEPLPGTPRLDRSVGTLVEDFADTEEENVPCIGIGFVDLAKDMTDNPVIEHINADNRNPALSHIWNFLLRQPAPQVPGPLLSLDAETVFYVKNGEGTLRALHINGYKWSHRPGEPMVFWHLYARSLIHGNKSLPKGTRIGYVIPNL